MIFGGKLFSRATFFKACRSNAVGTAAATIISAIIVAGCSSSLFDQDPSELDSAKNSGGRINQACFNLDLSQSTLSVDTTLKLVDCLNGNGSLQAYSDLLHSLSHDQMQALLDVANEQLFLRPERIKALDTSLQQMDPQPKDPNGLLNRAFTAVSRVLEKDKTPIFRYAIKLLRQTAGSSGNAANDRFKLDADVLKSIQVLAQEATRESTGLYSVVEARRVAARALEMSLANVSLSSYDALMAGLKPGLYKDGASLEDLTRNAVTYLQTKIAEPTPLAKQALWGLADGALYNAFDNLYSKEGIDSEIHGTERFFRMLSIYKKEELFGPTIELFRVMNAPIVCMAGTKQVPNADIYLMDELSKLDPRDAAEWTVRSNVLKLALANGMCEFPRERTKTFNDLFEVIKKAADYTDPEPGKNGRIIKHRPLVTVAHLAQAMKFGENFPMSEEAKKDLASSMTYPENERFRRFLVDLLGDKNQNVNVYTHLSDALAEISSVERGVLSNTLYLLDAGASNPEDRLDTQKALRVLMKQRSDFAQTAAVASTKSVYDVFSKAMAKAEWKTVYGVFEGLSKYAASDEKYAQPLIESSREALLMNNANPVLEMALGIALEAPKYEVFFSTLFDIADTDKAEAALQLTGTMAGNGSLKDLLKGFLGMYRTGSDRIPGGPVLTAVPAPKMIDPSRDKSTRTRGPWDPIEVSWPANDQGTQACFNINLDVSFAATWDARWSAQLKNIADCVDANGQNRDLKTFITYGLEKKIGMQSFLAYVTNLASSVIPDMSLTRKVVYDEFSDTLVDPQSVADVKGMNELLPFMFEKKYCSLYSKEPGFACPRDARQLAVMEGLLGSLTNLRFEGSRLQSMFDFGKTVIQDNRLFKPVALLYDLKKESEGAAFVEMGHPPLVSLPVSAYPANQQLKQLMSDAVQKYEGHAATAAILAQKEKEYFDNPLTQKIPRYTDYAGKERIGYKDSTEFKAALKPLLDELSQGYRIDWLLTFFFYMDKSPYSPEWWADWFQRLADKVRVIPYYYPGTDPMHDKPVAKFASELDLLELIVEEADFTLSDIYGDGSNHSQPAGTLLVCNPITGFFGKKCGPNLDFAVKNLSRLAQMGPDMNPAINEMERELDFFSSLANDFIVKRTLKPEVRRRVFNLNQVFPILREVNRNHTFTQPDGSKVTANDLGVLRDLFKAVLSSSPNEETWNDYTRPKNPLSVVTEIVRFGFLRNVGMAGWSKTASGQIVRNDFGHVMRLVRDAGRVIETGSAGSVRKVNPTTVKLLSFLLRENCDRSLPLYKNGCVVPPRTKNESFDQRYVFLSKLLDTYYQWTAKDDQLEDQRKPKVESYAKRSGYYLTSLLDRVGSQSGAQFNQDLLKGLTPILGSEKGTRFMTDYLDLLEDLLTDGEVAALLESIVRAETSGRKHPEAAYSEKEAFADLRGFGVDTLHRLAASNGQLSVTLVDLLDVLHKDSRKNFRATVNALRWMKDDPAYNEPGFKAVRERMAANFIHWLPKESTADKPRALRARLQLVLGDQLSSGKIRDLTLFLADASVNDEFYQKTKFIGTAEYVRKLNEFIDLLRSGIVDVQYLN